MLEFVRERGVVHPREVDAHFAHGKATNWFGGRATHRRSCWTACTTAGCCASRAEKAACGCMRRVKPMCRQRIRHATMDTLVDIVVNEYAPLPAPTLSQLVVMLAVRRAALADARKSALARAKERLPHATIDGRTWYWPEGENPRSRRHVASDEVRLLAPFDPVVWDRRRFESFWGWAYRFEAYTPAPNVCAATTRCRCCGASGRGLGESVGRQRAA